MKPREERLPVMIAARMRVGKRWCDARILNISSRGLMLCAIDPPPRGSYLELRRGRHVIVARVMWVANDRIGVRTQDVITTDDVVRDLSPSAPSGSATAERRAKLRNSSVAHEASRWCARGAEYVAIMFFGAALATAAVTLVSDFFGSPIARVESALVQGGES